MITRSSSARPLAGVGRGLAVLASALLAACATGNYDAGGRYAPAEVEDQATGELEGEALEVPILGRAPIDGMRRIRMAFPTGDPRTSAVLLEKEVPEEVVLGTQFEYRIRVENLTDQELVQVRVKDELPAGLVVDATEPVGRVVGNVARWDLGMLAPGSVKTLVVRGTADQMGTLTTSATVDYVASLQASTKVVAPVLEVAVQAPPEGVVTRPFDLTVKVSNAGTGAARDVRIVDVLPAGLTTVSGQKRVVMDFGGLESGQSKEKSIRVAAEDAGRFDHVVRAEAAGGLEVESRPVTTVVREPRLTVNVEAPELGDTETAIRVEIVVANTGDGPSEGTTLRCKLPVGVELVSTSADGGVLDDVVSWWIGDLDPGASKRVAFTVWREKLGAFVVEAKANARGALEVTATSRTTVR